MVDVNFATSTTNRSDPTARARLLHPAARSGEPVDESILHAIAAGLGAVAVVAGDPGHGVVERSRLLATEAYDAWLLVWGPGAVVEPHDHDGSIGVLHVVGGQLLEVAAGIDGSRPMVLRRLDEGATSSFGVTELHGLRNPTQTATVAVAVYSPPLGETAPPRP